MDRDNSFCAKSVRYNIFTKGAPYTTPLQERHFPTSLRHAEKQPLCWNWAKLTLQCSLL